LLFASVILPNSFCEIPIFAAINEAIKGKFFGSFGNFLKGDKNG